MISVVTAYYNRKKLFIRTLDSMLPHYGNIEFEVIAVDDGSQEEERLENLQQTYPFLRVIRLEKENKWYSNSCIPFNKGFEEIKGDKVIIQNPECYHLGDILVYVQNHLKDNLYLSFGCYSLDKSSTENIELFSDKDYLLRLIQQNDYPVTNDGELGWYNHSIHRNEAFHFCAAITYKDLYDLGGFDERYAKAVGYDDNEIIWRIKAKQMQIKFVDEVVVLHQNHYIPNNLSEIEIISMKSQLYAQNKQLFTELTQQNLPWKANILHNKNRQIDSPRDPTEIAYYQMLSNYIIKISKLKWSRKILSIIAKIMLKFNY